MSGSVGTRYTSRTIRARLLAGDVPEFIQKHIRRDYIVKSYLSCPPWADRKALRELEKLAARLTLQTGIPHELNHIVPISHPLVCGLTVPWNMEVITRAKNNALSNCFDLREPQEQLKLIPLHVVEQYRLNI
jgi:hypothetical protein